MNMFNRILVLERHIKNTCEAGHSFIDGEITVAEFEEVLDETEFMYTVPEKTCEQTCIAGRPHFDDCPDL